MTARKPTPAVPLLRPKEVGDLFGVVPKTVARWAKEGRLRCIRTPGGHARFIESEVMALRADAMQQRTTDPERELKST